MTTHDPAIQLLRGASVRRDYSVEGIEIRSASDDPESTVLNFRGHASVTDRGYPMYGGAKAGFPGFDETIVGGAFKKTLSEKPDVAFLVNHGGMTLARTKAGTLRLTEDKIGLATDADLDKRVSIVNDLAVLMETKALDEMSFAFRVVKDQWLTDDGDEAPWWDEEALHRNITEVSLNKGDVSVVNYGANPFTSGSMRSLDDMIAEVVAFRGLSALRSEELERSSEYLRKLAAIPTSKPMTIVVGERGPGSDGTDIVAALKRYQRMNGDIPVDGPSVEEWRAKFEQRFLRSKFAA